MVIPRYARCLSDEHSSSKQYIVIRNRIPVMCMGSGRKDGQARTHRINTKIESM